MGFEFGSSAWADELRRTINDSSEYRQAAAGWGDDFDGSILFVFEGDSGRAPVRLWLRLARGQCDGAEFLDADARIEAGFRLRGPLLLWRSILEGKTLAATALLTGKLAVEGDKMRLLRHTAANRALIHCTASVDTVW